MASPADTADFECLANAETIVAFGAAPGVGLMGRGMSVAAPTSGHVTIDGAGEVEFAGDGKDRSHGAMGTGLDAKGIGGPKPNEQIISLPEVSK